MLLGDVSGRESAAYSALVDKSHVDIAVGQFLSLFKHHVGNPIDYKVAAVRHFLSHFAYFFHLEGIDTFAVFGEKRGSFRVDAVVKAAVDRDKPCLLYTSRFRRLKSTPTS